MSYASETEMRSALRGFIKALPNLTDLEERQVLFGVSNQAIPLPRVMLHELDGGSAGDTHDGDDSFRESSFQVTINARRPSDARDIWNSLMGLNNTTQGSFSRLAVRHRIEFTEPEDNTHVKVCEIEGTWNLAVVEPENLIAFDGNNLVAFDGTNLVNYA
jgi:hypothetical protein